MIQRKMVTKPVVGMHGPSGCGKDTVTKILCETRGFKRLAFADPLKDAASILFGVPREDFDDDERKELPTKQWPEWTPRGLVQWLGTDVLRTQFHQDFLLKRMQIEVEKEMRHPETMGIAISDVRFDNEAELINNELEGVVLRVNPGDRALRKNGGIKNHVTERALDESLIFEVVDNSKSVEDLPGEVDRVMQLVQKNAS